VLVVNNGEEVAEVLRQLTPQKAKEIGKAARDRVLAYHTYAHRAKELETVLSR